MTDIRVTDNSVTTSVRVNRTSNVVRSSANTETEAINNISQVKVISKTNFVVKELAQVIESGSSGSYKFAATIGDGFSNTFAVHHNFHTTDVLVQIFEISSGDYVDAEITITSTNIVTITTALPPSLNSLRVVVSG